MSIKLKYTGGGYGGFLPGVPARDLEDGEVKEYGEKELLASGLYEPIGKESKATKPLPAEPDTEKEGE